MFILMFLYVLRDHTHILRQTTHDLTNETFMLHSDKTENKHNVQIYLQLSNNKYKQTTPITVLPGMTWVYLAPYL